MNPCEARASAFLKHEQTHLQKPIFCPAAGTLTKNMCFNLGMIQKPNNPLRSMHEPRSTAGMDEPDVSRNRILEGLDVYPQLRSRGPRNSTFFLPRSSDACRYDNVNVRLLKKTCSDGNVGVRARMFVRVSVCVCIRIYLCRRASAMSRQIPVTSIPPRVFGP